jgi:hypothetical protein
VSLAALLTQTVTVRTIAAGAPDRYGVPGETVTLETEVQARVEQTDSLEISVGELTIVSDWRAYFEADVVLAHRDQIVDAYGRTFEVVGAPDIEETPRGPHHVKARLRYVE